jgi:hypothetical protein
MTENAVHMPLRDFAQKYLFGPLGGACIVFACSFAGDRLQVSVG